MEITLQVAKAPQPGQSVTPADVFMTCSMTMVALDPVTKKPVNIAPLKVESPEDKALFAKGEENYKNKKALKGSHILSMPPNEEESAAIHKMWTENLAYADTNNPATQPSNTISMAKSNIHSTQISQPQYRNRYFRSVFYAKYPND